jgi:hypothetical protein
MRLHSSGVHVFDMGQMTESVTESVGPMTRTATEFPKKRHSGPCGARCLGGALAVLLLRTAQHANTNGCTVNPHSWKFAGRTIAGAARHGALRMGLHRRPSGEGVSVNRGWASHRRRHVGLPKARTAITPGTDYYGACPVRWGRSQLSAIRGTTSTRVRRCAWLKRQPLARCCADSE